MKELKANILSDEILKQADAVCFTSNGVVKSNGELVMGGGVAKSFANKWPSLPDIFGDFVKHGGNKVWVYGNKIPYIVSFPTKHHWKDKSDIQLIKESAEELVKTSDDFNWKHVYLPFPGIGLGGLSIDEVRQIISPILDDRITVCYL